MRRMTTTGTSPSPGLHNDTFEVVVDGDRSGGPLIPRFRNNLDQDEWDAHFSMHGVQAQNYHIFTPSEGKDWALAWGCQPWDKELPWANHAQNYHFRPGRVGQIRAGVLHHAFRLCGLRRAGAGGRVEAV